MPDPTTTDQQDQQTKLQRLMALLCQHQLLSLRRGGPTPDQPAKPESQHGGRQQDPPEPGVDHLRLR